LKARQVKIREFAKSRMIQIQSVLQCNQTTLQRGRRLSRLPHYNEQQT
jgi:hypothetical protein